MHQYVSCRRINERKLQWPVIKIIYCAEIFKYILPCIVSYCIGLLRKSQCHYKCNLRNGWWNDPAAWLMTGIDANILLYSIDVLCLFCSVICWNNLYNNDLSGLQICINGIVDVLTEVNHSYCAWNHCLRSDTMTSQIFYSACVFS